ncbi:MAG: glycosyltransferase family 2 protein [Burkholderia gladioli]|uniref:glycosyltransferase family 2 protein n=1 Tax=Burkholderia gladioli TaxID=28095 RepID=UPI00163F41A0|nr:glycosyltransferase family 2 protein [Burkholderia gladioli]
MHSLQANLLSVSIVVYRPDLAQLTKTLSSLLGAIERLDIVRRGARAIVYMVDNGETPTSLPSLDAFRASGIPCVLVGEHGNVGYGRGHNLAIERAASDYHLVLNPDIDLDADALVAAFDFFDAHPDVGLLSPRIADQHGHPQFLCRRYPALLDLLVRGFLPHAIRWPFEARLARYEMRDCMTGSEVFLDPPIVSGCFMLFRTEVLKRIGGFDPRYFLYFEDYDLSLRTRDVAHLAFVPSVRVVHHGGGASRKGFAHIRMFAASALKFYRRFGWRWW